VCVGRDVDTQFCANLPSCSDVAAASAVAPAASSARQTSGVLANRWTAWSEWSKCSVECGVGFRSRTRKCYGAECAGCDTDFEQCENRHCSELMEITDWTPWVRLGGNSSVDTPGSWHEKRFKFTYRSPVSVNAAGRVEDEERFCTREHCSTTSIARSRNGQESSADYWSDWSKCTRECGTGYQLRVRTCAGGEDCRGGVSVAERACNTHPCPGQWTCWSEWSGCDRAGKRRRARECASVDLVSAGGKTGVTCAGGSSYEELPCDGWGPWGAWTECDRITGHATRFRTCDAAAVGQQCAGADRESKRCDGADVDIAAQSGEAGVASIIVACVCGFVLGAALGAALVYYFLVFRRGRGASGSPHYVSAKSQNLYVSLPMLDLHRHSNGHLNGHHKTLTSSSVLAPSECGTLRSTTTAGTLRSKASSYSKGLGNAASATAVGAAHIPDYETATIKRSHSHRNSSLLAGNMRADLDSDQIFT
jgi:chondroitin sulfate proteoglycan 4